MQYNFWVYLYVGRISKGALNSTLTQGTFAAEALMPVKPAYKLQMTILFRKGTLNFERGPVVYIRWCAVRYVYAVTMPAAFRIQIDVVATGKCTACFRHRLERFKR